MVELDLSILGGRRGIARKYKHPAEEQARLDRQIAAARIHRYARLELRGVDPLTDEEISEIYAVLRGGAR